MTAHQRYTRMLAVVFAALCMVATALVVQLTVFRPATITAIFTAATAVYPGDDVRVAGVKVGTIKAIEPQGTQTRLVMAVDHGVPIPSDAKAVLVAQNLVSARYIQLAPAYTAAGPTLHDGAVIPIERTAVPVEWDDVKDQLTRLATELGPASAGSTTAVGHFIDSAADALGHDNDRRLRETLSELSGVGRILADGSPDLAVVIKHLQTFITALRDSNEQIVQFQNRFATLTSVLDGSRSDLDATLTNVAEVVGRVQQFVADSRGHAAEQVERLSHITQTLVDHQRDLEQILHVAPTAIADMYNMFDPRSSGATGVFTLSNFADPSFLFCSQIAVVANVTAQETSKLCTEYLGPGLRQLNFNQLPFNLNPLLNAKPPPQDIIYSEPNLAPGGSGPTPSGPDIPPAVSAYPGAERGPAGLAALFPSIDPGTPSSTNPPAQQPQSGSGSSTTDRIPHP